MMKTQTNVVQPLQLRIYLIYWAVLGHKIYQFYRQTV